MAKTIERDDPCWSGCGKKCDRSHEAFDENSGLMRMKGYAVFHQGLIKTPAELETVKTSCRVNIAVFQSVA